MQAKNPSPGALPSFWQGARTPLLIFLALAGVIGGMGYLVYAHQKHALRQATTGELLTIADHKVTEISRWLAERRTDAGFIARDPFISQAIRQWLSTPLPAAEDSRLLEASLTNLKETFAYSAAVLFDPQGQARLGAGDTPLHPHDQALARQAVASGQVILSDLRWHPEDQDGPIHFGLFAPVGRGLAPDAPAAGILFLKIDPERYLFPLVQSWPTPSPSAETLLVRRDGDQVLYLNELRHRRGTALRLRFPADSERLPAALAVRGVSGVLEGMDYRQVPVLAAVRPVPGTVWFLVAKIDAEEVYAPLRTLMLLMAAAGGLLITAAGAGVGLWWRQQHAGFVAGDITARKHYQEQLAEAERFARATLDALSAHLCVLDETGTILRVNRAWREFAQANGVDPARVAEGVNYLKVCATARGPFSEGAIFFAEGIRAVLRGVRREFSLQYPAHSPTEQRWFLATVTAFQGPGPTRMVIAHENITALKQTEARVAEQRDLLEIILNQAAEAITVCDRRGNLTLVNAAARRLAMADAATAPLENNALIWGTAYDAEGRPIPLQEWPLPRALRGQAIINSEVHMVRPDGSYYDILISAAPLRNARQDIIGAVATFSDITERKRMENALRESEARLRAIVNAVPDVLLVLDEDGRYVEILTTRSRLLYTEPAVLKGKLLGEVVPAKLARRITQSIRQTLLTRQIQSVEYELQIRASDKRYFEARTAPLEGPVLDKPAVVLLARDITQHRLTEDSLRQAQKMEAVGQLTGGIAHDFNNLLGVIIGNLDLLAETLDRPELKDLAVRALGAAERGATLVSRLLAFARRQPLQAKPVDLNRLVLGMTDLLRHTLGETIRVETALSEDLAQTVIDPGQFEAALLNLALNARDAMPAGGRLTIKTANVRLDEAYAAAHRPVQPGRYVLLAVSDTGVGMPAKVLERAFEPFFTTKEVGKGSGLGLSMVYGLVKQSEGYIELHSEAGRGTTIQIYLPPREPDAGPVLEAHSRAASLHSGQGQTILVVEDEAPVRQLAVGMLRSLGYRTLEADTAATALQVLETTPQVALLFTDVVLPGGMSGIDLARAAQQRRPDLKVLFTSGYSEQPWASLGPLQRRPEWLGKPYRKSHLAIKLRTMLDTGPPRGLSISES